MSAHQEKSARRPRVFSGSQPSGTLHLGNYLGAIRNYVAMQETHDCIYCVVDLHAITVRQVRAELRRNTIDVANAYLASGVDPERSIVFVQSHVPEHTELMWILNTVTYMGELRRMTQFKDKTAGAEGESIGVGLFDYPVLMAADILLYRADAVPVGEDQKQHVELTRDLAERFNNAFGKTFVVPEPIIRSEGARVMSLDDPTKKMSKSAGSENSYVAVMDAPDVIRRKIRRAVTDSGTEVSGGPDKPALTNLLDIYGALAGEPVDEIERRYEGKGTPTSKPTSATSSSRRSRPSRSASASSRPTRATRSRCSDRRRAREAIAGRTLARVRERVGLARPSAARQARGRATTASQAPSVLWVTPSPGPHRRVQGMSRPRRCRASIGRSEYRAASSTARGARYASRPMSVVPRARSDADAVDRQGRRECPLGKQRDRLPPAAFFRRHHDLDRDDEAPHRQTIGDEFPLVFWRGKGRIVACGRRRACRCSCAACGWTSPGTGSPSPGSGLLPNHTLTVDELGGGADAVGIVSLFAVSPGRRPLHAVDADGLLHARGDPGLMPVHQYADMYRPTSWAPWRRKIHGD